MLSKDLKLEEAAEAFKLQCKTLYPLANVFSGGSSVPEASVSNEDMNGNEAALDEQEGPSSLEKGNTAAADGV